MNKLIIRKKILRVVGKESLKKIVKMRKNGDSLKNYHFMSANLLRFMPHINPDNHIKIYKRLLNIRALEGVIPYLKTFDLDNFFSNLNPEKFCKGLPAIYISYHLGAYRTAILPMVKYNIDIAIVVDSSIYTLEQIENELNSHFLLAKEIYPSSSSRFEVLSANNKSTIIELMNKLNKGFSILTYIDWNVGSDNNKNNNIVVNFFNNKLSVKQSIAYLSYYTKRPIIPFISYYNKSYEPNWKLFDTISPINYSNIHEYSLHVMQHLYSNLEKVLKKYYSQWIGWFHIHKSMILENNKMIEQRNDFDSNVDYRLGKYTVLFIIADTHFIFNKITYKIIKLPPALFEIFSSNCLVNHETVEEAVLQQLYQNYMLEKMI